MFEWNSKSSRSQTKIAARAWQEANRTSPAFSRALHERIMRAVELARCAPSVHRPPARSSWRGASMIPAALAAAVTLMVLPLPGRLLLTTSPTIQEHAPSRVADAILTRADRPVLVIDQAAHDMNARVKDVIQTAMVTQQWAGLDHDVRLATQYFVDQVPLRSAWDGQDSGR